MSRALKRHSEASKFAAMRVPFHSKYCKEVGTRIYGKWSDNGRVYTVYSYRDSWPMYCYDNLAHQWYAHTEKYSRSTTLHFRHAQPVLWSQITIVSFDALRQISHAGVENWVLAKIMGAIQHSE